MHNSMPAIAREPISWQPLILPLIIVAVGTAVAFVQGPVGALIILIGYIWLVVRSVPAALAVYIVASPFVFGLTLHRHHVDVSDAMALIMAIKLAIGAWPHERIRGWWKTFFASPFWRPLLLVLILAVLSLATALSHSTTIVKILEYIEFFVVVVAVARKAELREDDWKPVIWGLFGIASLMSLYGLYQFVFQVGPIANVVDVHHVRAEAVFGQPNAFGGFEAMVFPFVAALLAYGPKWSKGWWAWVTVVLVALGVIASFSRGAWVAAVASVVFMAVLVWVAKGRSGVNRRFVFPAVIIPILGFIVIDLVGKTNLSHHLATVSYQTTGNRIRSTVTAVFHPKGHYDTDQRLLIWKDAIRALKEHPVIGVGLGGFHRFAQLHPVKGLAGVPPMAHDLYLEWGADMGVLGIVAALWLEWSWIRHAVSGVVKRVGELSAFEFAMGVAAFGTIVSFVVHDWVDFMIDHGVVVPLLLALAVVWVLSSRKSAGGRQ